MSTKHESIDAECAALSVVIDDRCSTTVQMRTWLGVSRFGFYEWRKRPELATARRREELKTLVRHFFDVSDEMHGYRRIHAYLADHGWRPGPKWCAPSCGSWVWSPDSHDRGGSA